MKRNLSISTAAAALLIGTVFAGAQGVPRPGGGGAEPGVQGGAQGQGGAQTAPQEGQGKGKAQQRTQGQGGQTQGQQDGQPGQQPKQQQGQQKEGQQPKQQQGQQKEGQQPRQQQGQQTPQQGQPGAEGKGKAAEGKGGAQSGGVTLNAQQRTTIRTTVLQGSNAPRVSNVNFSINVGTVVPRTGVTLVTVPSTLVEIHPAWSGYLYFIVGERIIIVDPDSHAIVAVLVV